MKHHFKYIVFLFLITCSSASTIEGIIPDTSTSSSTTTIITTTTTMPVLKEEKQFKGEKAYISELEVGDCYVDEELNYLPKFYKEIVFKTPCEIVSLDNEKTYHSFSALLHNINRSRS